MVKQQYHPILLTDNPKTIKINILYELIFLLKYIIILVSMDVDQDKKKREGANLPFSHLETMNANQDYLMTTFCCGHQEWKR